MHQALHGNSLSWAYTVEWPGFAVVAVLAWWHLIHEDPASRSARLEDVHRADLGVDEAAAADGASGSGEMSEAYAARVAAAAGREYRAHLARLAESEWLPPGARRERRGVRDRRKRGNLDSGQSLK